MRREYINIRGTLMSLATPRVMGIVNVTDDSFYAASRVFTPAEVGARIETMLREGVDILDIGGYSSRPGAAEISVDEEIRRLSVGIEAAAKTAPHVPVSIDTFRAEVVERCCESGSVDIINDISGGTLDEGMWPLVAELGKVYILMHTRGTPATMQTMTDYEHVTAEVETDLAKKIRELHLLGVNDIIADPGFGFAKTLEQNYQLMAQLSHLKALHTPLLVGVSRKSMIHRLLNISPAEALNATTALNTVALMAGANILRVHDVLPAKQAVAVVSQLSKYTNNA